MACSFSRKSHKEKVLRVEVKLNLYKHYIIYYRIAGLVGE